ncbi:FHA domain-containing protein [Lysobacter solisilvae (ex Woo and Kim 2022)]|uniref:FHA domain-containing protein n=1 Tax=Agrilutibacter terrestris TaxID=2865112 RepID=A0A7H0FX45_9GAMM|nr:FHA domain-containing protein [Lysobacter terrestris]QNP40611.1 FHA domain-containing protein [Lysobacter terrestris]
MAALRLRFPNRQQPDLVLGPGVHAIGRDATDRPVIVDDPTQAIAQFCVDRRGVWLQVHAGTRGLHVNGRPVRRMAQLRAGDAVFVDGNEWLLLGDTPPSASGESKPIAGEADPRTVLRGVGGPHHGRSITLDQPRLVGRLSECDIRIDDAAFADRHARLEPHPEGIVLRDLGSHEGSLVNGWPVRNALLRTGDQVVFDTQRFIVEGPSRSANGEARKQARPAPVDEAPAATEPKVASSVRRVPWLLLAALFLAIALSLLLLYGAR